MSKFNLQIDGKIKSTTKGNVSWWYGGGAEAWGSLSNAKAGVPAAIRSGQVVGVLEDNKIVEYIWYPNDISDNGLVLKQDALPDNIAFTDVDNDFTANQTFKEATFERAFSQNEATANNELVRLDQLNSAVSGLNWQDPIDDIIDFTTNEPTSPTIGDRYINSANGTASGTGQGVTKNNIYEWDGSDWAEFVPVDGWTVFDRAVDQNFTFNGTSWVEFGSTVSHNNTTGLQGGQSGQYYHLSEAQYLALSGGIDAATLNGQNGAYYLNYNNFTNVPDLSGFLVAADLSPYAKLNGGNEFSGNQTIIGTISANNLSGTNTGNETKASIDALGVDAATLQGQNGAYYLDYNNFSNKPTIDNYGYFQLQTNSVNRKQIASQNILNFLNGFGIAVTYTSNGGVVITNSITNNNQLTNGAGYVTSSGNTIIGTDDDINTSGAQVIDTLVMTDGVITSHSLRTLTLANLGFTGDTNANRITNNNQITNGAGYITSAGNTQLSKEQVEDYVGLMVQNNVETNISVTYDDSTNKLNFASVNTQLSDAQVKAITDPLYLGKTAKAVDSDKLDGQDSTYYLNYNNFSNTPNLGVYAKLSGGNEFSGNQTFISTISMKYGSGITGSSSGVLNKSYLEFDESDGTTRQGFVGFGSPADSDLYLKNDVSGKQLRLKENGVLDYNGDAAFSGDVSANNFTGNGATFSGLVNINNTTDGLQDLLRFGTVRSWVFKTNNAGAGTSLRLYDESGLKSFYIESSNGGFAKFTDGNATFSGNVEVGGDKLHIKSASSTPNFIIETTNNSGIPLLDLKGGVNSQIRYINELNVIQSRIDIGDNGFFNFLNTVSSNSLLKLENGDATFSGDVEVSNTSGGSLGLSNSDSSLVQDQLIGELVFKKSDSSGGGSGTVGGVRMKSNSSIGSSSKLEFSLAQSSENDVLQLTIDSEKAIFSGNVEVGGTISFKTDSKVIGNNTTTVTTSVINYYSKDDILLTEIGYNSAGESGSFIRNVVSGKTLRLENNNKLTYSDSMDLYANLEVGGNIKLTNDTFLIFSHSTQSKDISFFNNGTNTLESGGKIQASGYKSSDGSEGMTTTFNGVIYKNGLAVGTSV